MDNFGKRLKLSIKNAGLTQKSVSEILNISPQALTNYITKNRIPEALILYKLSSLCAVSMEMLLTGKDEAAALQPPTQQAFARPEPSIAQLTPADVEMLAKLKQLTRDNRLKAEGVIEGMLLSQGGNASNQPLSPTSTNTERTESAAKEAPGA